MESITIRLKDKEKEIIKKASEILGVGYSGFIKSITLEKARETLIKNNFDPDNLV